MNLPLRVMCTGILLLIFMPSLLSGAHVFLKDGAIHKGRILNETAAVVVMCDESGAVHTFNRGKVMRVLYTDLYMGKVFVRLTDGTVIEAYQVDEDRTHLTFRKDIAKPEEFTLRRDKILFIARKNPNELKGVPDYHSIALDWKPPLGQVKKYRVYIRRHDESYPAEPTAETTSLSSVIKNLESSTDYRCIVTAVDEKDYESLPSNEVEIQTKNYAPLAPEEVRPGSAFTVNRRDESVGSITLEWDAAKDRDGEVTGYRIYPMDEKEPVALGETKDTRFILRDLPVKKEMAFAVHSVDNRGDESEEGRPFELFTWNRPPEAPTRLYCQQEIKGAAMDVRIKWSRAEDPDDGAMRYVVYEKRGAAWSRLGTTDTEEFLVQGRRADAVYTFRVQAVDNGGLESPFSEEVESTDGIFAGFMARGSLMYIAPLGDFSEIHSFGLGFKTGVYTTMLLGGAFPLGVELAYLRYGAEDDYITSSSALLLLLHGEYRYIRDWDFIPRAGLSAGSSLSMTRYTSNITGSEVKKSAFEPYLALEAGADYMLKSDILLGLSAGYGFIYEKDGLLSFITITMSAEYLF